MSFFDIRRYRQQVRQAAELKRKDVTKLTLVAAVIATMIWLSGMPTAAAAFFISALASQVLHLRIDQSLPKRDADMPARTIFAHWVMHFTTTLVFAAPALILVFQPSVAFLLIGQIWLFGCIVHLIGAYALIGFYCWSLLVPMVATGVGAVVLASQQTYAADNHLAMILLAAAFFCFALNVIDVIRRMSHSRADVSKARVAAEDQLEKLEFLNRHDPLTGLLNRAAFDAALDALMENEEPWAPVTVFLIDLDGFKPINDAFGHEAGDFVLRSVATRLQAFENDVGVAARLGGDEFVLARPDLAGEARALELGQDIALALSSPVSRNQQNLTVGASVGVALSDAGKTSTTELCSQADRAMYSAKASPEDSVRLFNKELHAPRIGLKEKALIETALEQGEIRPFYQPKTSLLDGQRHGFEALVRWVQPDGRIVTPNDLMPLVNEFGLQQALTTSMANQVMRDLKIMKHGGIEPGKVSINIPECTLATRAGLEDITQLLSRNSDARRNIVLEITEDVVISRAADVVVQSIDLLSRAGIDISLDDFGTGYASFQHLREVRFDELKIDLSFVAELGQNPKNDVIVEGFLSMAQGLGARVVAEGVETLEQAEMLKEMGCGIAQGYLFGRPSALSDYMISNVRPKRQVTTRPVSERA